MGMGRVLLTLLGVLLIGGALVRGGAALDLWALPDFSGNGTEMTMEACLTEGGQGMRGAFAQAGLPADQLAYLSSRITESMTPLCQEAIRHPEVKSLTQESGPRFMSEMVRNNPSVWQPLCFAVVDSQFATSPELRRYVGSTERRRFRRKACRLQVAYMREDAPMPDYGALIGDHPDVYVTWCAPYLQASFAGDRFVRHRFTSRERRIIARRSCVEAMRSRVIDASGPGGFRNARVDQAAFQAIVRRVGQAVVG
jgi:hypothetical protein